MLEILQFVQNDKTVISAQHRYLIKTFINLKLYIYKSDYFVYIMTNKSRTLYAGVTNNLIRRVYEHKRKLVPGFTSKYNITRLVYYETFRNPYDAIVAEKRIKGWKREKKVKLIEETNPNWKDLSVEWFEN